MPRPGGEADKLGNQYESLWTVEQLLDLVTGDLSAITVESHGPEAEGVEFHTEAATGVTRYHSVKRQSQGSDWSISKLTSKDKNTGRSILGDLFAKLDRTSTIEICFVSATGANALRELVERARHSDDLETFSRSLSQRLRKDVETIIDRLGIGDQETFDKLRSLEVAMKSHGLLERDVDRKIAYLLYPLAAGPKKAVDIRLRLADFVLQELGKRIDRPKLLAWLQANSIGLRDWKLDPTIQELVDRQNKRYLSGISAELINSEQILRSEADELMQVLEDSQSRGALLVAAGGYGKSCVLAQVALSLEQRGLSFLCFRSDDRRG